MCVKLTLKIVTLFSVLGSASCNTLPSGCSELAQGILTKPTPHAELQSTGDSALDAQMYGLAETGQLNKANDDKKTGYEIIAACEVRDAKVRKRFGLF